MTPTPDEILNLTYQELFRTPQGQIVFKDLMARTGFSKAFQPPIVNSHDLAFKEGQRDVFAYIMLRVEPEITPELLAKLSKEAQIDHLSRYSSGN